MRQSLLNILRCPTCKTNSLFLKDARGDAVEIRTGSIICGNCSSLYEIKAGIADLLKNPGIDIKREQGAMEDEEYLRDDKGNKFRINRDTIDKFKDQFLLLPEGDGSYFFKRGGCFQSIAEASHRFYDTLKQMGIKGREDILALGDGFSYASYKFAKSGCNAVALDIGSYLAVSDLYIKDAYFERVFGDMHDLPFMDRTFDIVFCAAALHHSRKLKDVFSEVRRVLKPDGRAFIINECARGIFEKINKLFDELRDKGYGDNVYTILEWSDAAMSIGFRDVKIEFLSLADDYIVRQENRARPGSSPGFLGRNTERPLLIRPPRRTVLWPRMYKTAAPSYYLRLAYFFRKHPWLEKAALFLLKYPRILFRPKSWRMTCYN